MIPPSGSTGRARKSDHETHRAGRGGAVQVFDFELREKIEELLRKGLQDG